MSNNRRVTCYFGILNLSGLMSMKDQIIDGQLSYSQVEKPVFSTESYTIKTTFNRNLKFQDEYKTSQHFGILHFTDPKNENEGDFYQKKFRREVLWDFGDGTQKIGYSAEHTYKKPGRYHITCTFFDINRRAWVNDYSIYVVVKELLPTVIKFDTNYTKSQIYCSKIERIARLEATNSNTVKEPLKISAKRVFSKQEHEEKYQEIDKNFEQLPDITFRFMQKYWSFLENTQVLYYNSDKVHSNYLTPSQYFTPHYTDIYGKFYYDPLVGINVSLYQVISYKHIDDNLQTIKILDPNKSILSFEQQNYVEVSITQVYAESQLPSDVFYVGRRGFCDIFYRNDFIGHSNTVRFTYDLESVNITGQLDNSTNYINTNPLGFTFDVKHNELDNVKIGISTDGFLRDLEQLDSFNNYYIDPHLYNTLYKGIDLDLYIFPFISYDDEFYIQGADSLVIDVYEGGFETYNKMYYIPKDLSLHLKCTPIISKNKGNSSFVNHGLVDNYGDKAHLNQLYADFIIGINPWFYRVPVVLQDYINLKFDVYFKRVEESDYVLLSSPILTKFGLKRDKDISIPVRKSQYVNLQKLLEVYMSHPMFQQTDNLKDALRAVFGDDILGKIMTQSVSILDDTNNVKTCYLSNLVSMLKMMGEDVTQFEKGAFDGNNDMKDFVRLLSMNHADLVGHLIEEDYDITVSRDVRGVNVGDEIDVEDVLSLNKAEGENLGKITHVNNKKVNIDGGVHLIMVDRYTNVSKEVSLYHKQMSNPKNSLRIGDYQQSWGWNLLLPISFSSMNAKITDLNRKINDGRYSNQQRLAFAEEVKSLQKKKRDLIKGYYRFFLLNPTRKKRRVGNFISDSHVNYKIDDSQNWDARWGITHDILMKILIKNCYLNNNRTIGGVYEDGQIEQETTPEVVLTKDISITQKLGSDVAYNVKLNGKETNTKLAQGEVFIEGKIDGAGKSVLTISSNRCIIDQFAAFNIVTGKLEVRVSYNGKIDPNKQTFRITGTNVYGTATVSCSGSVEYPIFDVIFDLDFVDERMDNQVVFDENNIFAHMKDYFVTNLRRQQLDSASFANGIVDNSNSVATNRSFTAALRFGNTSKLGKNVCYLDYCYTIGNTSYNGINSLDNNVIEQQNVQVDVTIDYNGQISFDGGKLVIPVTYTTTGGNVKGNLYFVLSGNAVLGTHVLNCYSYDPDGDITQEKGLQTLLVHGAGLQYRINHKMADSHLLVNGTNGISKGYYIDVQSIGKVYQTIGSYEDTSEVTISVYNPSNAKVYQTRVTRPYVCSVTEDGYVFEDTILLALQGDLQGSIVITTNGGYYEIVGYALELTLK